MTPDKVEIEADVLKKYKAGFNAYNQIVKRNLIDESEIIEEREIRALADSVLKESVYIKDVFNPVLFVQHVLNSYPGKTFITPVNDQGGDVVYRYDGEGVFNANGIPFIEGALLKILDTDAQTVMYRAITKHMQVSTYTDPAEFVENPYITVMKNGSFNVLTGELEPHSPEYMAKCRIPVVYDADADCPAFKAFLEQVLPKLEHRTFWMQWMGYHLLKDYRFQRTVVLQGEGDNGKSTLLNVLATVIGADNIATETLFRLSSNRFSLAELAGKMANISADVGPKELRNTGPIKTLTGGDWITAERKNRDPFSFKNYAKMTFSCNQLPKTPDRTLAFYKRFIVIVTGPPIPLDEQDPTLIELLTSEAELSGIFNLMVESLNEALELGKLDEPTDIQERKTLYQKMSEPEIGFTSEYVIEHNAGFISKSEMLRRYTIYCDKNGFVPSADKVLYDTVRKNFYCREARIRVNDIQTRGFKGISWIYGENEDSVPAVPAVPRVDTLLDFKTEKKELQIGGTSGTSGTSYPSVEQQEADKELIDLARVHLKNNGGESSTADLVKWLIENEYDFIDFKRLQPYKLIFKFNRARIALVEES